MAVSTSASTRGRASVVVVVAMLIATAVAWGLFVHDPAPNDPQRPAFLSAPDEPLPAPTNSEPYEVTATLKSNYPEVEQTNVVRTKVYYPDGEPVVKDTQLATGEGPVVQRTTYQRGDREYVRATYDDPTAFRQHVDEENVVLSDPASLTYYEVDRTSEVSADIQPRRALEGLYLLRYEKRGETTYKGHEVVRYEAVSGWTTSQSFGDGDAESIYVRQADGEVLVDEQTGAILKADVTGSFVKADNWADVMTHDSYSVTITYTVDTDVEPPSEPPWVDSLEGVNETATDEFNGPRADLAY